MKDIFILQIKEPGLRAGLEALRATGEEEKGLVSAQKWEIVAQLVSENRQLLITGILGHDIEDDAYGNLAALREDYPNLVCVSFSSMPLEGPFDRIINKTFNHQREADLQRAILDFRSGTLIRT